MAAAPIKDQKRTRKSLVTHYWRANDMARHKLGAVREVLGSPPRTTSRRLSGAGVEAARRTLARHGGLAGSANEAGWGAVGALSRSKPDAARLGDSRASPPNTICPLIDVTRLGAHRPPTTLEPFHPEAGDVWREGYRLATSADALAGLTVAIVALPLSMAIAIASGRHAERGLYTAIVGGFLVSLLGGSRFQIGGPAGAFIVLVAATVQRHGVDGLLLATMMAGVFLIASAVSGSAPTSSTFPIR